MKIRDRIIDALIARKTTFWTAAGPGPSRHALGRMVFFEPSHRSTKGYVMNPSPPLRS